MNDKTADGKLKREISKRWPMIDHDMEARAQLEYILQEAGLLAKPRKRRKKTADEKPITALEVRPQHTLD